MAFRTARRRVLRGLKSMMFSCGRGGVILGASDSGDCFAHLETLKSRVAKPSEANI